MAKASPAYAGQVFPPSSAAKGKERPRSPSKTNPARPLMEVAVTIRMPEEWRDRLNAIAIDLQETFPMMKAFDRSDVVRMMIAECMKESAKNPTWLRDVVRGK